MTLILNGVDILDTVYIYQQGPRSFRVTPGTNTPGNEFAKASDNVTTALKNWAIKTCTKSYMVRPFDFRGGNTFGSARPWSYVISFGSSHDAIIFKLQLAERFRD